MSNILKAIFEDIEEYEDLCRRYGEEVTYSQGSPDCYGSHARELISRRDKEFEVARAYFKAQQATEEV